MINPVVLPLCSGLAIQWYGIMVAIGVALLMIAIERETTRLGLLTSNEFHTLALLAIVAGVIGGKLVYLMTESNSLSLSSLLAFFEGGFSILGTVLAITLVVPWYLYKLKKPLLPIIDIIGLYAPIAQGFGRIGCLIAGCCYGAPTTSWFSVMYTHTNALAPLNIALHPTQLYSSLALFMIFGFLYCIHAYSKIPGIISMCYLFLIALERFILDFWRDDRIIVTINQTAFPLSFHQLLALAIMLISLVVMGIIYRSYRYERL